MGRKELNAHARATAAIESCPPNPDYATSTMLGRVSDQSDYVLFAASKGDWGQAMSISYDAARQAV